MESKSYCVKCKKKTDNVNPHKEKTKNNRNILKSKCKVCGTNKTSFIK